MSAAALLALYLIGLAIGLHQAWRIAQHRDDWGFAQFAASLAVVASLFWPLVVVGYLAVAVAGLILLRGPRP